MGLLIGNVSNSILPERVKEAVYEDIPMYGVKFPSNSTVGVRTYDAANLNWSRSDNTTAGLDDFKDLAPFNVKEVCRVWDGTTATYLYKSDYSDAEWQTIRDGTHASIDGDIMIEVPEFWYRRVDTGDGLEIIVAPEYKVGFTPDPWHYEKGVHHQKRYISKYPIGSGYKSRSGIGLQVDTNMNTFRTNLRNKGLNMISAPAWYSLVTLMLVKYANTDAQATVSFGWAEAEGDTTHTTGSADNVLGLDGSATSVSANEGALTFGIESFYGDCWKYIDGCFIYDNVIYLKDVEDVTSDPTSLADLQASYTQVATPVQAGGNETSITSIANDTTYDWLFHPSNTSGSSKTIVCNDIFWSAASSNVLRHLELGGNAWNGTGDGFFCCFSSREVGSSGYRIGSLAVC